VEIKTNVGLQMKYFLYVTNYKYGGNANPSGYAYLREMRVKVEGT
jgi:hypothetical protein